MSDAIRDQLIEAINTAPFGRDWDDESAGVILDALLALRDSDGIPLVLGLVADEVSSRTTLVWARNIVDQILDEADTPVKRRQAINDTCDAFVAAFLVGKLLFVPRLSEDKPHE